MIGFSLALIIYPAQPSCCYDPYVDRPYDTRQLAHPYNPGPKIIIVPQDKRQKPERPFDKEDQ